MTAILTTICFIVCAVPAGVAIIFLVLAFGVLFGSVGTSLAGESLTYVSRPVLVAALLVSAPLLACAGIGTFVDQHVFRGRRVCVRYAFFIGLALLTESSEAIAFVARGIEAADAGELTGVTAVVITVLGHIVVTSTIAALCVAGMAATFEVCAAFLSRAGGIAIEQPLSAVRPLLVLCLLGVILQFAGRWLFLAFG